MWAGHRLDFDGVGDVFRPLVLPLGGLGRQVMLGDLLRRSGDAAEAER
jgi:hypothetical protein